MFLVSLSDLSAASLLSLGVDISTYGMMLMLKIFLIWEHCRVHSFGLRILCMWGIELGVLQSSE